MSTPDGSAPDQSTDSTPAERSFSEFGLNPDIVAALADAGIHQAFPIQALTLPVALQRHDIIGQAKTGTGKTLGFGLPLLDHVVAPGEPGFDDLEAPGKPQALVVVPTRELAVQVANDLAQASTKRSVRIATLYGGRAYEPQVQALRTGIEVVVGTPGRLMDLAGQRHLTLKHVHTVVLDEADEMLDLGFLPDVEKILTQCPPVRHTMLFSATMPAAVVAMARRFMTQPTHIRAHSTGDSGHTVKNTKQVAYRAHAMDKIEVLARILQATDRGLSIVFTTTKRTAAKVSDELSDRGFAVGALHGDLGQGAREQALRAFRGGKLDVLVATDVAARGIDVDEVTHVINYQCPEDDKTYVHRVGRTGRAGRTGTAVTFVDWDDLHRWSLINKALDLGISHPQETYSTSDHLFTDLDIPTSVSGSLPRSKRTRSGLDSETLEDLGETGRRSPRSQNSRSDQAKRSSGSRSGGRGDKTSGDSPDNERSARPARQRTRRRTRAGETQSSGAATPVKETTSAGEGSTSAEGTVARERPARRRSRRRSSAGDSGSAGPTVS